MSFLDNLENNLKSLESSEQGREEAEREREIFQLAAEGNSNKEIAGRLSLSTLTVETHRKRVAEKLNLHGLADLILYAVRKGIIPTARSSP